MKEQRKLGYYITIKSAVYQEDKAIPNVHALKTWST